MPPAPLLELKDRAEAGHPDGIVGAVVVRIEHHKKAGNQRNEFVHPIAVEGLQVPGRGSIHRAAGIGGHFGRLSHNHPAQVAPAPQIRKAQGQRPVKQGGRISGGNGPTAGFGIGKS